MKLLKYKIWTLNWGVLVAQELGLNRQFGVIQRQIEIAQGQLKMLNTSAQERKSIVSPSRIAK
jgi:hypothetical protein